MRANNFKDLVRDEMVKRFESVVLDETQKHTCAVHRYHADLIDLKCTMDKLIKDQQELFLCYENLRCQILNDVKSEKKSLFEKFEDHRRYVNEQVSLLINEVNSIIKQCEKNVLQEHLKDLSDKIAAQMIQIGFFIETRMKGLEEKLYESKKDVLGSVSNLFQRLDDCSLSINEEKRARKEELGAYTIDVKGTLKELQVYKKSMFILEKKIENIYTLIDRLKVQGAS